MMGDRFGEIVKISRMRPSGAVRASLLAGDRFNPNREIAHVKLDKSGKTVRVILDDCREV
jgi:hypothetical protein